MQTIPAKRQSRARTSKPRSRGLADPAFRAIENHVAAHSAFLVSVDEVSRLESKLPPHKQRSSFYAGHVKIFKTDDAEWIAENRKYETAARKSDAAAIALAQCIPKTLGGIYAILSYIGRHAERDMFFPDAGPSNWTAEMHLSLAKAVSRLAH